MPDLDSALRADANDWRAETDAAYLGRRDWAPAPKQPRRLLPALAAAVVAALVAVAVAVAVHRSGTRSGTHGGTTPVSAPLPTAPARVDKLDLITSIGAATPDMAADVPVVTDTAKPGLISTRWELTKIGDGGRTLFVSYEIGSGSCDRAIGFRVTQTATSVELTSVVHHASGNCTANLIIGGGIIHLNKPLGKRQLLHAPVTE